ncbi:MAG TPA: DUF1343 domain-containing protein [Candidatus Polarisedimenticolia bacterium]|nr:DUF1343 domain-containing protein [Candidatus Polarisedimenticolia bacterium]
MRRLRGVVSGLEALARARPSWLKKKRIGLLMHQASVTRDLVSARDVLHRLCGASLKALFGPQHGIAGELQDNMIESPHAVDSRLGLPIFSLYSETRSPTPDMLDHIDTLVVDLQDVGTRVYTFEWTTALALSACAAAGKSVVVLDRPNPLGGVIVEGNLIRPGFESFVGLSPVPMRHGLTLGEMARLVNARMAAGTGSLSGPPCDLTVIPMQGWRRRMRFGDTGLPWVLPSPNMPTPETTTVYPGQVLLEGTNLSEGRGTTRPFEVWGSPYLDAEGFRARFSRRRLPGCVLREHDFEPTFHKWHKEVCRGFQIHVTDPDRFLPYLTTLSLLQDTVALHRERFAWKQPPYEYVVDRLPIDVLTGDPAIREAIESGADLKRLAATWKAEIRAFQKEAAPHLLYRT